VDRSCLYRHRDLLAQIHAVEAAPPVTSGNGPIEQLAREIDGKDQ
jgi:hypothetical protein